MDPSKAERKRPPMPESVGRYEVLLPIASGGMATIYLARSRGGGGFEREVALKLTHAHLRDNAEFANDVIEEAKLAVRIRHPNVVSVLDAGDDPYGVYLVMDYIEGDTLGGLMRRPVTSSSVMPMSVGLRILVDGLRGLHAAHELAGEDGKPLGLVHRDFTPQNILVGTDGVSRLADFGIARAESRLGHTRTGNIKGKYAFMSPEQARMAPLDRRTDVWAAGVIAWEMFTRQRLYPPSGDDLAILLKIATENPPRASSVRADLHPAIDDAIAHALTRDLKARSSSAEAFADELVAACKLAGLEPASYDEVGALVRKASGAKIAERRAQAKEVSSLRARVDKLADTNAELTPSSLSPGLSMPKVSDETAGRETIPGDPDGPSNAPSTRSWIESEPPPRPVGAPSRRQWGFFALGGAAALGIGTIALAMSSQSAPKNTPESAVPATQTSASLSAPPPPATAVASAAEVPSTSASVPSTKTIALSGNASIASVKVGDRTIAVTPPAKDVSVELSLDEARTVSRLEVVTTDGRRASVALDPKGSTASVRFASSQGPLPGALPASPYGKHNP